MAITKPPAHPRLGRRWWTTDEAARRVSQRVVHPREDDEKVSAILRLADRPEVATQVATVLLHRPEVANHAMTDSVARNLVNRAQYERARETVEHAEALQRLQPGRTVERTAEFIDLVGVCALFVATTSRTVPKLRGSRYSDDERGTVHRNLARVRAAADWIETAIDSDTVVDDDAYVRLLTGDE